LVLRAIGVLLVIFIIAISLRSVVFEFAADVFALMTVCVASILTFIVLRWLITNLS
jgi:hypothetical protein